MKIDARAVRAEKKTLKTKLDVFRGCLKRLHRAETEANNEAFAEAYEALDEERDSADLMIRMGNSQGTDTRDLTDLWRETKGVMDETFIMKGVKGFGKEGGGSKPKGKREEKESEEEEEEEEEEDEESSDEDERVRNKVKSEVKKVRKDTEVERDRKKGMGNDDSDEEESSSDESKGSFQTVIESLSKKKGDMRKTQGTKGKEREGEEEEEEEKKSRSSSGSSKKSTTKKREGKRMELELERRKEEVRHMERMIEMNKKEVEIEEEEEEEERRSSSKGSSKTTKVKKETKPKKTGGKKLPKESSKEERKERISKWIDGTKKKNREEDDVRSMIESLSATTAAILRHHAVEGKGEKEKTNQPSMLEAIKIVERHRPKEKFTGANRSIDFEDHVRQFRKAVDVPGLPASYKLAELTEWFDGLARMQIRRFLRRDDHQVALEEALEKLELEHGARMTSAEEMLEDLMTGGKLEYSDAIGLSQLVSGIEEKYALAEETGRDAEFGRANVWKLILDKKVPHLRAKWAVELGRAKKRKEKEVKFESFIDFLNDQKINAMEWWSLKGVEEREEGKGSEDGATKAGKKQGGKDEKEKDGKRKEEGKGSGMNSGNSGMGGGGDRRTGGGEPSGGWTRPFEQGNGWQTTGSGWNEPNGSGWKVNNGNGWNGGQNGWQKANGSGNGNGSGSGNGGSEWPRVGESGSRQGGSSNGGSGGSGGMGGASGGSGSGGIGNSGTTYIGSAVRGNSNCKICGFPHFMNECPTFLKMNPNERFEFCAQRRVCTKCTRGVHPVAECRYNGKCWTCQGEHHSLIHGEKVLEAEKKMTVTNASIAAT